MLLHFIFYVPESHVDVVKEAVFQAGAGRYKHYDCACWQTKGEGQFRPLEGSDAFIGEKGKLERVIEYKVETICDVLLKEKVLEAFKKAHPYEEPAYAMLALSTP